MGVAVGIAGQLDAGGLATGRDTGQRDGEHGAKLSHSAGVAQRTEHQPSKLMVTGSIPVSCSISK